MIDLLKDIANHLTGQPYVDSAPAASSSSPITASVSAALTKATSDRSVQQASKRIIQYRGVTIRDMGGGQIERTKQVIDDLIATGHARGVRQIDIAKYPRHRDGTIPLGWCNGRGHITLATNGQSREQMLRNAAHETKHFHTDDEDIAEAAEYEALAALERILSR